jgi:hypothetical protein
MTGCVNSMGAASATSDEICRQNGEALPTRSRDDTIQTQAEIQEAYAVFSLTCHDWAHLIPA